MTEYTIFPNNKRKKEDENNIGVAVVPEGGEDEERDDECSERHGVAGDVQTVDHLPELQ